MKQFWKRAGAALMAVLMLLGTTACSSEDMTWAAKRGEKTIPIGAYIYYLFSAYNDASSMVEDSSQSVLSQTVEGQDAETWIRAKAMQYIKTLFVLDDKMEEMGLSFTEEEQQQIENSTNSQWTYMGSVLENEYGIAKSSFQMAYPEYVAKYTKIFDAIYGRTGTSPVPEEDVKNYFEENYTSYAYMLRPLYHTSSESTQETSGTESSTAESSGTESSSSSSITEMTDEEIAAAKKEFDDFAAQITAGQMTAQEAAKEYQESTGLDAEQLSENVGVVSTDNGTPEELVTLLEGLSNGQAGTTEVSLGTQKAYLLAVKYDISEKTEESLADDTTYDAIISAMKGEEYSQMIEDAANNLKDVEINEKAMNSYKVSMFE